MHQRIHPPIRPVAPSFVYRAARAQKRECPPLPVQVWETQELRRWLSHARKLRRKWLRQLRQMAATRGWRSTELRHRVSTLLASPTLYWLAFYEALKADGTLARQNDFIWSYLENLGKADERFDPRQPCDEPYGITLQSKPTGFRTMFDLGPRMTGRSKLIGNLMRAMLRPGFFALQSMHRGVSRRSLLEEVRMICGDAQWRYFAVADVADFFGSISHDYLRDYLPFPEAVVRHSITHPLGEGGRSPETQDNLSHNNASFSNQHRQSYHPSYLYTPASTGQGTRRGIPQGASSSPIIAYSILEQAIRPLNLAGAIFQWADDIVIFGRSLRDVEDQMLQLSQRLRGHRAGPLSLGKMQTGDTGDGFDFHGHRYMRTDTGVRMNLTTASRERFLQRLADRIATDLSNRRGDFPNAMAYLDAWSEQAVCDERAQLYSAGLTEIDIAADRL